MLPLALALFLGVSVQAQYLWRSTSFERSNFELIARQNSCLQDQVTCSFGGCCPQNTTCVVVGDTTGCCPEGSNCGGGSLVCSKGTFMCSDNSVCCDIGSTCVNTTNGTRCCPSGQPCLGTLPGTASSSSTLSASTTPSSTPTTTARVSQSSGGCQSGYLSCTDGTGGCCPS